MFGKRLLASVKFISSDHTIIELFVSRLRFVTLVSRDQITPNYPNFGYTSSQTPKVRMLSKIVKRFFRHPDKDKSQTPACTRDKDGKNLNSDSLIDSIGKNCEKSLLGKIEKKSSDEYLKTIQDLNFLQSNTRTIALSKYTSPNEILPLFAKQLNLAGIYIDDLNKLRIIHISGTKGKGSTCAFLESILKAAGKKTGFYNSPHLIKVTERIRIDGEPIDDDKFTRYFRRIYDRLLIGTKRENMTMPSYFSFLTILAFHIFIEENVDAAVIEVGIGGEYDPTNIVENPIACGISTLDYDHTNILGNSIEEIAWSKAGIAKKDVPLFTIEQEHIDVLKVFRSRASEKNCPIYICKPLNNLPEGLELGIRGSAQFANASLACQLAMYFLGATCQRDTDSLNKLDFSQDDYLETNLLELPHFFREALESCTWPGRCQVVRYPRITFFLDGAHTKKSMENCLDWFLNQSTEDSKKILMVNIIGERNKREVLRPLSQYNSFDLALFSTNKINTASDASTSDTFVNLQSTTSDKSMENVHINVNTWISLLKEYGREEKSNIIVRTNTTDSIRYLYKLSKLNCDVNFHVLVTGSLHFVGAILQTLTVVDKLLRQRDE